LLICDLRLGCNGRSQITNRKSGFQPTSVATFEITLIFPEGERRTLRVAEEDTILAAAYREDIDLPSTCLQGWCLSCAARVEGGGEWDQTLSRRYYAQDREAGFILLCTAQPRSNLVVRTHQREAMVANRVAKGLPTPMGKW
jgi:ferredoxin